MVTTLRVSALALGLVALAGCSGMTSSQSTGAAPTQTAQASYIVPPGYVSGQRIIPYEGHIASKCDHHMSTYAKDACLKTETR